MSADQCEASNRGNASGIKVRRPCLKDLPAILEISNWATCHTTANFKTAPDTLEYWIDLWNGRTDQDPWFVADHNGSVIGFAIASPFKRRCGYAFTAEVTVFVHPAHLAKGIGRRLYSRLIPTLKAQGFKTLIAVIAIPNPASERLHAKFNFRKVGVLERVGWKLGKWRDVAYWQLILKAGDDEPAAIKNLYDIREEFSGD